MWCYHSIYLKLINAQFESWGILDDMKYPKFKFEKNIP